eukprot:1380735-Rhodomonas_salina.1
MEKATVPLHCNIANTTGSTSIQAVKPRSVTSAMTLAVWITPSARTSVPRTPARSASGARA